MNEEDELVGVMKNAAAVLREDHIEEDGGCFACETEWPCWAGELIGLADLVSEQEIAMKVDASLDRTVEMTEETLGLAERIDADVHDLVDAAGRLVTRIAGLERWEDLALHALSDLRVLGVPIEKMLDMTPEVLDAVERYDRDSTSYS